MPAKSKHGTNRIVAQLSDENYLYVMTKLTPPGELSPPYGMLSRYLNGLIDAQRSREAQQEIAP